jgi:hypothetical protein
MDLPWSQMRPKVLNVLMDCEWICKPQNPVKSAVTGSSNMYVNSLRRLHLLYWPFAGGGRSVI